MSNDASVFRPQRLPFASQRAGGQDLATHLVNEHDNEYMEVAEMRGAVAQDLHGAFAEWEAQAGALTKCKNYLYSLSVNPDPAQGRLTRAQYMDYMRCGMNSLALRIQQALQRDPHAGDGPHRSRTAKQGNELGVRRRRRRDRDRGRER